MSDMTIGLATGDDETAEECARFVCDLARRDGGEPDEKATLGGIRGRLRMPGADLLVAQRGAELGGFAVVVRDSDTLDLFHLAALDGPTEERLRAAVDAWAQASGCADVRDRTA